MLEKTYQTYQDRGSLNYLACFYFYYDNFNTLLSIPMGLIYILFIAWLAEKGLGKMIEFYFDSILIYFI